VATASLTEQLQLFLRGDKSFADTLIKELTPKLREIAFRSLRRERYMAPLSPTELINEFWVSSFSGGGFRIEDRGHFFAIASRIMRNTLVDLARKRLAERRGGGAAELPLDGLVLAERDASRIVEIGILMDQLGAVLPDSASIVDMHYFAGLTLEEVAAETRLTVKQVRGRWEKGLKWLKRRLRAGSKLNPKIVHQRLRE
jgi:RNA polymerase sigma factor (TIGR02999 family)